MSTLAIIEGTLTPPRRPVRRFTFLYGLLVVATLALVSRSFYLQVWRGSQFLVTAEGNRVATIPLTAPRGIIYDSRGRQLVENSTSTDVVFDPTLLPSEEYESPLIEQLPPLLDITPEHVRQVLHDARQKKRPSVIVKAIDHDVVLRLEEIKSSLPGITLASSLVRQYPYAEADAHVIGYTGPVTSEELARTRTYLPTDITGKTGIERYYDTALRGQHGAALREVNAAGQIQKELGSRPPQSGESITLALDQELQSYIFALFADKARASHAPGVPPTAGAVVAIDPRSGAIRALVSYPSFDPNIFSQPRWQGSGAQLFADTKEPLFNRATDGEYPPGSTIKPFLAAAGLAEAIITPQTTVFSSGQLTVGPWQFPDWKRGGHGVTDVNKAIAESVNTFFYLLAGGTDDRPGLGVAKIKHYLEKFGLGRPTEVDLPSEGAGFLPSPAWKEATKHERWYIGDTYHLGIGQGDILVTPLQLATATAVIANGGLRFQPRLTEKIVAPHRAEQARQPKFQTVPIDNEHLLVVGRAMRDAVMGGSAHTLANVPLAVAGKTGTAQIGGSADTHAWLTSFGPYPSAELVITVLLEKGGEGNKDAAPFAKNIWQWWAENRGNE